MGDMTPQRGIASSVVREVRCKDCARERASGSVHEDAPSSRENENFAYNETWARRVVERGGSRTDRCERHRRIHAKAITSVAVAYVDLETLGEAVGHDAPDGPFGPLGGLGPLPGNHIAQRSQVDLSGFEFGMNDEDILDILRMLSDPDRRVLILKAGTGTGKSTFGPFRLMSPPDDAAIRLTDLGRIVVTEPRIQATTGVARYVGEKLVMGCPLKECSNPEHGSFNPDAHLGHGANRFTGESCRDDKCDRSRHVGKHPWLKTDDCVVSDCARHIGPGFSVGYQVSEARHHDAACQLVYVTDGTMVNWLSDGRLNEIGTIIVDEAHERSTNIDFIMAFLERELDRYPHLRVIITSATFDTGYYKNLFGAARVNVKDVPATKQFGYGAPLFASSGGADTFDCSCERVIPPEGGPAQEPHPPLDNYKDWLEQHWPESVELADGSVEHPRDVTNQLRGLRFSREIPIENDRDKSVAAAVAEQVIRLADHLDAENIHGDILAFLPSSAFMEPAIRLIEAAIPGERADLFGLIQSAPLHHKEAAIASRERGAKRKIVVATNIAETSLTVSGVRFVIDSGLATQSEWDVQSAEKSIDTNPHSQAGIRQRWGRVGRDSPGWVFPIYTKEAFKSFPEHTRPSSTRDNLEGLVIKAKAAGIDDLTSIRWPANYDVEALDDDGRKGAETFTKELLRSQEALKASGNIGSNGRLTAFGRETGSFGSHSPAFAAAVICADQLVCVPEVITGLALLDDGDTPQGYWVQMQDLFRLPPGSRVPEWRHQLGLRRRAFRVGGGDDLDMVLRIVAAWESSDDSARPWESSTLREAFSARWWLNHEMLLQLAQLRREVLKGLSPIMKEEVKRFVDVSLAPRARAAISRGYAQFAYSRQPSGRYLPAVGEQKEQALDSSYGGVEVPAEILVLGRRSSYLRQYVEFLPWAAMPDRREDSSRSVAFDLLLRTLDHTDGLPDRSALNADLARLHGGYPVGTRLKATLLASGAGESVHMARVAGRIMARAPELPAAGAAAKATSSVWDVVSSGAGNASEWPSGPTPTAGDPDEEETVQEPDDGSADETTGRSLGPEANDESAAPGAEQVDLLWEDPSAAAADADLRVELVDGGAPGGGAAWFEVVGYSVDGEHAAARLSPSLLEPQFEGDPALNLDLGYGASVAVVVGELVEVDRAQYRVFHRVDGRGRFMRAAPSGRAEPDVFTTPFGLNAGDRDFATRFEVGEEHVAEVVPAPNGSRTISLMHGLRAGLPVEAKGKTTCEGVLLALPRSREDADKTGGGTWGSLKLTPTDSSSVDRYVFSVPPYAIKTPSLDSVPADVTVGLWNAETPFEYQAVDIVEASAIRAALRSVGLAEAGAGSEPDTLHIAFTASTVVTSDHRDTLLAASSSEAWQLEVWALYQRSAALRVGEVKAAGSAGDSLAPFDRFVLDHPIGSVVEGTVTGTKPYGVFVRLAPGVKGMVHRSQLPEGERAGFEDRFNLDDRLTVRLLLVDSGKRQLKLSRYLESSKSQGKADVRSGDGASPWASSSWTSAPPAPPRVPDWRDVLVAAPRPVSPVAGGASSVAGAGQLKTAAGADSVSPRQRSGSGGQTSSGQRGAAAMGRTSPPRPAPLKKQSSTSRSELPHILGLVAILVIVALAAAAISGAISLPDVFGGGSSDAPAPAAAPTDVVGHAAADKGVIDAQLVGHWVPQLASIPAGDGRSPAAETQYDRLHAQYNALALNTDDYTADTKGYFVLVAPVPVGTYGAALDWCDAHGLDNSRCYARLITHERVSPVVRHRQR